MKKVVSFCAIILLGVGIITGLATAQNVDYNPLIGKWEGTQTSSRGMLFATYYFELQERQLVGNSEYTRPMASGRGTGSLSRISFNGKDLKFTVTYDTMGINGGAIADYTLILQGTTLKGSGYNKSTGNSFEVRLNKTK